MKPTSRLLNWVVSALPIFLLSCGEPLVNTSYFDNTPRAPKSKPISVYFSAMAIPYAYKEIGMVTVDDQGWGKSEPELMDAAIMRAQEMGADGIIVLPQENNVAASVGSGSVISNLLVGSSIPIYQRVIRATAIVKTGDKIASPIAPPHQQDSKPLIDSPVLPDVAPSPSVADELLKLKKLKDAGALTEDEFSKAKAKLLSK